MRLQGGRSAAPVRSLSKRYIPSIDGLRAFAVLSVIFYHMGLPFAKGGLLGVTVFFVISGYLITGLLTLEWESSGSINLPQFWLRRIRRLFPAIVTVIVVMAAVFTVCSPLLLTKMRPDIIPGLFWFENWWYILRDLSYFDAVGAPSPLTHFWSLAIEEQFYLVWPIILLVLFKTGIGKTNVRRICLVLSVGSAVAMAVLYDPQGDPSRVYYGTDTRAFSLLIGAWLSFAWPSGQLSEETASRATFGSVLMLDAVGVAAFAGIVAMCVFVSGFSDFMYYGGLVLCSVLSAIVIAVLAHPRSLLAKVAAWKPFVWVGKISYGMYLWHFPIICLLQPRNATQLPWWIYLVELALTVGLSAASYYLIETPIRTRGLAAFMAPAGKVAQSFWKGANTRLGAGRRLRRSDRAGGRGKLPAGEGRPTFSGWASAHVPALAISGVVLAVAIGGIAFVPPVVEGGGSADKQRVMSATLIKPLTDGVYDVVFIGDSVSLGANEQLNEKFPHGMIDTEGNRQYYQGIEVLQGYLDKGVVGDTVVMSMSTNGYAEPEELNQVMDMCGTERTVWFVNIRVPDERCDPNNQAIQECVDSHANARLIDWYGASAGHDDWFIEDGIHLTWEGRDAFANLVVDTMGYVEPTDANSKYDVVYLGDAVALDAVEQLAALFPNGVVDCSDARDVDSLKSAYAGYRDSNVVGDDVVFCLGCESRLEKDEVASLVADVGAGKRVWVVNSRTPSPFCEENNAIVAEVASANGNVSVVDWFAASSGHNDYLADNGMNLTEAGAAAYAAEVSRMLGDHATKKTIAPGNEGGEELSRISASIDDASAQEDTFEEQMSVQSDSLELANASQEMSVSG
ncbi:MAG: acyltransferase [Eggerthellaceae bacterium]|nr:acyltransferase [Eggerthellaceae bacterium]